jgi:DtxR family Mn-dependent transcriptional regulator
VGTDGGEVLSSSLEDYLESILVLERKHRVARVKDIADMLRVQMPSVTGALKSLKKRDLVNYEKNSFISLTEKGASIADAIQNRHTILRNFLEKILLLSPDDAHVEACKIEHAISKSTADRLRNCVAWLERELAAGRIAVADWASIIGEWK